MSRGETLPPPMVYNSELNDLIRSMARDVWGKPGEPRRVTSSTPKSTVTGGSGSEEDALTAATDYKFDPNFPVD
jgi:hypothetical protein